MRKRDETELPALNTRRWTIRRKAALLEALHSGALTLDQALERYALSVEEIGSGSSNGTAFMACERPACRSIAAARRRRRRSEGPVTA